MLQFKNSVPQSSLSLKSKTLCNVYTPFPCCCFIIYQTISHPMYDLILMITQWNRWPWWVSILQMMKLRFSEYSRLYVLQQQKVSPQWSQICPITHTASPSKSVLNDSFCATCARGSQWPPGVGGVLLHIRRQVGIENVKTKAWMLLYWNSKPSSKQLTQLELSQEILSGRRYQTIFSIIAPRSQVVLRSR